MKDNIKNLIEIDEREVLRYLQYKDQDKERKFVVPSAPGKRLKEDTKVTDLLYKAYRAQNKSEFNATFEEIKERYQDIIDGLKLNISLDEDFEIMKKAFEDQIGEDYAASRVGKEC